VGQQWVDATTIKGARAAGIACTVALSVLILASIWEPTVLFWPPAHPPDERMLMALLLGMPLSLALAMRDPVRNAGVCAVIGLGCAFLAMSRVFSIAVGEPAPGMGWLATVAFLAIAVALVVTYTRLRRPHPIIVRVVVAATALMPAVLYAYDWAVRAAYAGR
jgi:hypothetical protein